MVEEDLNALPSREIYNKLIGSTGHHGVTNCNGEKHIQEVMEKVQPYEEIREDIDKIRKALCYVSKMDNAMVTKNTKEDYCFALYFWVGKILSEKLSSTKFQKTIVAYHNKIVDNEDEYECAPAKPSTDPDIFRKLKKLFDYKKDETFICNASRGEGETPCPAAYQEYLREAQNAYEVIRQKYTDSTDESWYINFKDWYTQYSSKKKLELNCELKDTEKHELQDQGVKVGSQGRNPEPRSKSSSSREINTPAIAIPSAGLAFVGLPTVAFLAYRYNLLPPGIKNTFFGKSNKARSGRGKRSTGRHNFDDDTLTENDSSTEYGTVYSTEGNSTLGSSEYDAPSSSTTTRKERARTNNRSQQPKRTNISYGRM
ncbi:KIR protein [Plasmodium coatneyi]|uniref:KIR protein n=1 Tax=Plasmodium coatneyi TaxID=208452 RepID=A0A1B1DSX2_9APIC|nr:KIR protein [Plasmodium coatneyi]ANQ05896.1 KIR protein [Plasmodium coatneyi]